MSRSTITGCLPMSSSVALQFLCKELVDETAALMDMTKDFLASGAVQVLAELKSDIERIAETRSGRDQAIRLRPVFTVPTRDYEPGSRSGGQEIYASINGIWEVRPIGAGRPKTKVAFTGKASAKVELWRAIPHPPPESRERRGPRCGYEGRSSRLAMWRVEIGAHDSPGCHFHIQVLGDREEPPFPKSIPVPRLPSPFVTPMAAVEFVLGELFQDKWERRAGEKHHHHDRWRTIQRDRWSSLLKWQKRALDQGRSSPWMNLKAAKPPADLFLASSN